VAAMSEAASRTGEAMSHAAAALDEFVKVAADPPTVAVMLTWQELADLRSALRYESNAMPDNSPAMPRYDALEARLGEAHQQLPNPLDAHHTS
jgi:hypothetical protein